MTNSAHMLQQYLPDRPDNNYSHSLREHSHNKTLITKTADLSEQDFIIRNCISIVIKLIDYLDTDHVTCYTILVVFF